MTFSHLFFRYHTSKFLWHLIKFLSWYDVTLQCFLRKKNIIRLSELVLKQLNPEFLKPVSIIFKAFLVYFQNILVSIQLIALLIYVFFASMFLNVEKLRWFWSFTLSEVVSSFSNHQQTGRVFYFFTSNVKLYLETIVNNLCQFCKLLAWFKLKDNYCKFGFKRLMTARVFSSFPHSIKWSEVCSLSWQSSILNKMYFFINTQSLSTIKTATNFPKSWQNSPGWSFSACIESFDFLQLFPCLATRMKTCWISFFSLSPMLSGIFSSTSQTHARHFLTACKTFPFLKLTSKLGGNPFAHSNAV